jgi:hypothetical protein
MGLAVHNAGWGAGQSALGQRNSGGRRAAGGCAPHEGAPCRGGPVRTGSVQQLQRRAHARAPGVNPKESTEPISGPSGGAHGYAVRGGGSAAGAGSAHNSYRQRECARRLGSIPKKRLRARGGCSAARAGTQCAPGAGQCALGRRNRGRRRARARRMGAYRGRCWAPGIRLAQGAAEQNRWHEPGQRAAGRDNKQMHGGAGGG